MNCNMPWVASSSKRPTWNGSCALEDGMVIAYLTDPNGSMFALFSPRAGG